MHVAVVDYDVFLFLQAGGHAARADAAAEEADRGPRHSDGADPHHRLLLHHPVEKREVHLRGGARSGGHVGELC